MNNSNIFYKLLNLNKLNRLHHALLLTGQNQENLLNISIGLSKSILCLSSDYHKVDENDNFACNNCKSCKLFDSMNHPDFYNINSEQDINFIKIEQIRNIKEFCVAKPRINNKKIVVIPDARKMNIQASNAILKILEEPQGAVTFILLAKNKRDVLATIASRCLELRFSKEINVKNNQTEKLLEILNDLCNYIIFKNKNIIEISEDWHSKYEVNNFADYIYNAISIIIMGKYNISKLNIENIDSNHDIYKIIRKLSDIISNETAFAMLDSIANFKRVIKSGQNPNFQLYIESILTRIKL